MRLFQKLRWRWRVHDLPEGSDETDSDKNDSAAAVRLVIGASKWNPRAAKSLKYIWSETLPKGTVISSSRQHMIVLRSGTDDLGKWVWEEVDAYQDYRRLFGGDPRPVDFLGLITMILPSLFRGPQLKRTRGIQNEARVSGSFFLGTTCWTYK